jgi:hypothetical protein
MIATLAPWLFRSLLSGLARQLIMRVRVIKTAPLAPPPDPSREACCGMRELRARQFVRGVKKNLKIAENSLNEINPNFS